MFVFHSQMHLLTFLFTLLEFTLFCYQLIHYLSRPQDKSRFWYLLLLFLLILYNITGGLLPDPSLAMPIFAQNILAYGSGFLMASYFPYFFYKGLKLEGLRFHALYGVALFLVLPYLIFFVIVYSITRNLDFAIRWGMIVPFVYSFVLIVTILKAIRKRFSTHKQIGYVVKPEAMALYFAVFPWSFLTVLVYFKVAQWLEVLFMNIGFIVLTLIFIVRSVKRSRKEFDLLNRLKPTPSELLFEKNIHLYHLTPREIEVVRLIRQAYTTNEIADQIFVAPTTVSRHIQNIYSKLEVKSRLELMRKLELPELP